MQLETPSRIWRRIREGEARDADMPSLPSIPGFDDSAIGDNNTSLSLTSSSPKSSTIMLNTQCSALETSAAMMHTDICVTKKGQAGLPSGTNITSLRTDVLVSKRDGPSVNKHLDGRAGPDFERKSSEIDESPSHMEPPDYIRIGSFPSSSPAPDDASAVDADFASTLEQPAIGLPGFSSSSNAFNKCDFSKPHDLGRPPIFAQAFSPSLPSTSGLPSMSSSRPPRWDTGQSSENPASQKLTAGNVHSLQAADEDDEPSGGESEQHSVKVLGSQEPTFSSEDAETIHISSSANVHFPRTVAFRSRLSTPIPNLSWRAGESRSGLYAGSYQDQKEADDLATPLPRRKSFLLSVVNSTTRPRLAFPTPHPRFRLSAANSDATPGLHSHIGASPYEVDNYDSPEGATSTSFVSTASSHDLTVRHRANASFDPLTGPQGVGRFNAGKLNTYLHGLNRRLQEENEILVNRIRNQQLELDGFLNQTRHRELSGVVEDEAAEQWMLEKESLEQKVSEFEQRLVAKDRELADEQKERMRDKERWKERMTEVEDGVGQIVFDLEKRARDAETEAAALKGVEQQLRDTQIELDGAKLECQLLKRRAEEAKHVVANNRGTGPTPRLTDNSSTKLEQDVQPFSNELQEKERALAAMEASNLNKEKELISLRNLIRDLESSLRVSREAIETYQQDMKDTHGEQKDLKCELQVAQTTIETFKIDSNLATDQAKGLEKQLSDVRERLEKCTEALEIANERLAMSSNELDKTRQNVQQLENALKESDEKILEDNNELVELRSKLSVIERERDKSRSLRHSEGKSKTLNDVDVEALETELAEATKEIGRLTALLHQNPARLAIDRARDSRIDLLEKENQELLEQLRLTRDPSHYGTPHRNPSMNGLSPMHRHLVNLSMRTPRTPGEPLRNASWLMSMTSDISASHLVEEIGRLQKQLDLANESIDDKLDKLEEAGLGVVGLTRALEDARQRIANLEGQLEEREVRWLACNACSRCGFEFSDSASKDPNASLQLRLTMAMTELESLRKQRDEETATSSGEKAVLRGATNRLNTEIERAKEELRTAQERGKSAEKSKAELQQELTRARRCIDDLEHHLEFERSWLRTLNMDNFNAGKEKERILEKLNETERRMEQTKDRLFQLKETNIKLEAELRVERKAAGIEEALIGNRETIEQLRQQRSQLSDKYHDLQQQLAEASKNASDLAAKHAKLQMSYGDRRRQLDRQAKEIECLRAAFSSQARILNQVKADTRSDTPDFRSLASRLEFELKHIQREADHFGRDLVRLRAERDQLVLRHHKEMEHHERPSNQIKAQLRDLKLQLASRKEHSDIGTEIDTVRVRHDRECKGLFVQIRYLQAKFTREAGLRDDLGYQKNYLLVLLSRYEKSEKRILATIAQIGPVASQKQPPRCKSLRGTTLALIFIFRARQASETWREQRSACTAIAAALGNARKSRALKT